MHSFHELITIFDQKFKRNHFPNEPYNLYEPAEYFLSIGGKRIRPVACLMANELFGTIKADTWHAADALELFHNFTLLHDDVMDNSSVRRGQATVHERNGVNTAILSGDAMLIKAYQYINKINADSLPQVLYIFNKTAIEVCEGQQYDMDFETRDDVTVSEYMKMIEYKTAVLVGAALQMGAITVEASEKNKKLIYDFGVQLGMAFQLQDDYLDTFGDDSFGKKIGGDILENKKTILYLKTLEKAFGEDKKELLNWYSQTEVNEEEKINAVTELFQKNGVETFVRAEIEHYTQKAFQNLTQMDISEEGRAILKKFGVDLMNRTV